MVPEKEKPDPRGRVQEEVRDDEGPGSPKAQECDAEEHAHREVAREPTPPLIQVVRTAKER